MTAFKLHNDDCSIVEYGVEVGDVSSLPAAPDGFRWTEVPTPALDYTVELLDGKYTAVPYVFSPVIVLSSTKAAMRNALSTLRDVMEWAGCATPVGRSDTTPDSQRKVNGAVTMALIASTAGAPFSIDWTMADNSSATLDAQGMIALGVAVGRYVSACHDRGAVIKAAIDAAATIEALEAIDIAADWPT
ncbi:DUF4376 domain-containing protein [Sphingomonas paeninsulae]|uniref:DUF4376 domain-containing protein n=1 Tax=Sphingomonas paeninsulae TaxID=2319844 RepID=A0A494TDV1_SPHPE|nr:DUF4376 domain-containing protein [Sphingomonas paeninsulae]AYJ87677.1 DUF4376 domain-containing protein [Sphingomonas paeninsulae]